MSHQSYRTSAFAGGILAVLAFAVGCGGGGSDAPTASASGKITFKGEPVNEGVVSLIDEKQGAAGAGKISSGQYQVKGLKPGEYKAAVAPPTDETPATDPNNPPKPKEMANIPKKYRGFDTSELKVTVKEGGNTLDIQMQE